jgi:hypothetical protein
MTDANKHGGQHGGQQGNGPQGAQSMHNTPADAAAHERDVTHALRLTQEVQSDPNSPDTQQKLADIASILQSIDARTGRRDPSQRAATGMSGKVDAARSTVAQAQTTQAGTPDWMALIADLLKILTDLHVVPTPQSGGANSSPTGSAQ